MTHPDWQRERLYATLTNGLTRDNAEARIHLLVSELNRLADSPSLKVLSWDMTGSIDEYEPNIPADRPTSALRAITSALRRAGELGFSTQERLALIQDLPALLLQRTRIWLIGTSEPMEEATIGEEIANAIQARNPTGDDLVAIDRLAESGISEQIIGEWTAAMPDAPSPEDLGKALASDDLPEVWRRGWLWAGLLPEQVSPHWSNAVAILNARYGPITPERFRGPRITFESYVVSSPISAAELKELSVADATATLAKWERGPFEHRVGYRELARALKDVVAANAPAWAENPIVTISQLKEPLYISHYIEGLVEGVQSIPLDAGPRLLEALEFVGTSPWGPTLRGRDDWDYEPDWRSTIEAGVELIGAMASRNINLGPKAEAAWHIVSRSAMDTLRASSLLSPDRDPYETALNRPCCRALMSALQIMGSEFRTENTVSQRTLDLLNWVLVQPGQDGKEFRSILGSRLGFLRHVATAWVDQHADELFGSSVDEALGVSTLLSALRWGQPNKWLFEHFPDAISALAMKGEERAIEMALLAMVWEIPEYEPALLTEKLGKRAEILSLAGHKLAMLLRPADVPEGPIRIGRRFWSEALAVGGKPERLRGFGWFSVVPGMKTHELIELMLDTVRKTKGQVEWAQGVASRICCPPQSANVFEILRDLLMATNEPWVKQEIAASGVSALEQADATVRSTNEYHRLRESLLAMGYQLSGL